MASSSFMKFLYFIARWFASALAVMITAYILPGVHVKDFITGLIVAAVLSLMNTLLKPILIALTIPITVFTLGFFLLAINAFLILLTDKFVADFRVDGFWWAVLFSIVLSIVNSIFERINRNSRQRQ